MIIKRLLPVVFLVLFFVPLSNINAQESMSYEKEIQEYQSKENKHFKNPVTSILKPEDIATFESLDFYPINESYKVKATFIRTPDEKPFLMFTTTDRLPKYVKYGEAHFTLEGKKLKLNLYQSVPRDKDPEFVDYLFLPFTDLTSGNGSYGGGRFIDAYIPEGKTIEIDFNKAYNPYCAYNEKYSCPIPPRENDLLVRVEAGIKDYGEH